MRRPTFWPASCTSTRAPPGPTTTRSQSSARPRGGVDHISFECREFDDLGMGYITMVDKGHTHRWGIGRHLYGSQVFDYWTDPAGFHVEHYVDGDLVNDDNPTRKYPFGRDTLLQWGPAFPGL